MSYSSLSRLRCICWFSVSPPSACYWHQCCGESPHTNGSPEPKAKHSHDQMVLGPKEGFLTVTKAAATSPDSRTRSLIGPFRKTLMFQHMMLWTKSSCSSFNRLIPQLHHQRHFDLLKNTFLQSSSSANPNQYIFLPFKPHLKVLLLY